MSTLEAPVRPSTEIVLDCAACQASGMHEKGVCYRCAGKRQITGDDILRNANFDVKRQSRLKGVVFTVMVTRGVNGKRVKRPRVFGPNTEIYKNDELTRQTGTRVVTYASQLRPGEIIVTANAETKELLEVTVESVTKESAPAQEVFA